MPNTSSNALTMALKKVFSVMENQGRCGKASFPARYPELEHLDGSDESRQSTMSGTDSSRDLSISDESRQSTMSGGDSRGDLSIFTEQSQEELSVKPKTDRFEVMPNTSSNALTMALKKAFSVMENQSHYGKASVPARYPELEHLDGSDESRQSTMSGTDSSRDLSISTEQSKEELSTMSGPDRQDVSISNVKSRDEGQEIIWVEE
jgi:hypothetical protein